MFDSGISVKDLIEELNTEVDIALDIPNSTYVEWLNSLQQLLYTEIIKEQKKATITKLDFGGVVSYGLKEFLDKYSLKSPISISEISVDSNESQPRFEDIHTVYADSTTESNLQLIKSTVASGGIFPNTFYKDNNDIGFNTKDDILNLIIVYFAKPALIGKDDDLEKVTVMVPIEFIDLVKAKLRGEAYKIANEDNLAAKWLNDYNILLETFKAWITEKSSNFGV